MMRALGLLLRLLPRTFRAEYEEEIRHAVAERWKDVRETAGLVGAVRFWVRQALALVRAAVALRIRRGRGAAGAAIPVDAAALLHPAPRPSRPFDSLALDVRYGVRALLAQPASTAACVLTLGLGIGATTIVWSGAEAVLLRPLPYREADRVVTLFREDASTGARDEGMSAADVRDLAERARTIDAVAVAEPYSLDMLEDGRAVSLRTWNVSEGFFEAVGAEPLLGRTFTGEDYREGRRVVVLGHTLWQSRFGADPAIVGGTAVLDGAPHEVVGVMGPDFAFPDRGAAWSPRAPRPYDEDNRAEAFMTGVARLADGASLEAAQAELDRIAAELAATYPETNGGTAIRLVPLRDHIFGGVRTPLLVLAGAVGVVLLIACANVAGLQVARSSRRRAAYALRTALGATRARLVRLSLLESALLAAAGGLVGLVFALLGVRAFAALAPAELPLLEGLRAGPVPLLVAGALTVGAALLAGLAPAVAMSRTEVAGSLAEGARGTTRSLPAVRLGRRLIVAQVALAVVLLMGSGLLVRSFARLMDNRLGFEPEGRLAVQLFVYGQSADDMLELVRASREAIAALPGVRGVALTSSVPLATDATISSIESDVRFTVADGAGPPDAREALTTMIVISDGYAEVMGMSVVSGRSFSPDDDPRATPVAMVNEAFARRWFGDEDPVGRTLLVRRDASETPVARQIVGVLGDVRPLGFESEPRAELYLPFAQYPVRSLTYVVQADVEPESLLMPVQEAIWQVDPSEAVWAAEPLEALLGDLLRERRFNLAVLSTFAALALALSAVGLHGLLAHSVEERAAELAVRKALGGRAAGGVAIVAREVGVLVGAGLALGIVAALALARTLRAMLYGVEPADPIAIAWLAVGVLAVAAAAALVPAMRAARTDPMRVLRSG